MGFQFFPAPNTFRDCRRDDEAGHLKGPASQFASHRRDLLKYSGEEDELC
jgi:hypothetical protein